MPKVLGFGSLDIPLAPAPEAAKLTPEEELRLGWVQALEVPMDRRDSIVIELKTMSESHTIKHE